MLYFRPQFGTLQDIPGKGYLDAIDEENANVVIIMHLYHPVSMTVPPLCPSTTKNNHHSQPGEDGEGRGQSSLQIHDTYAN